MLNKTVLVVRAVSRKILQIMVEAWNLLQMFLNLCWGKFSRETRLKPTRLITSALFLQIFFSENLNKLHIIRFLMLIKLYNKTMVWICLHFKIFSLEEHEVTSYFQPKKFGKVTILFVFVNNAMVSLLFTVQGPRIVVLTVLLIFEFTIVCLIFQCFSKKVP